MCNNTRRRLMRFRSPSVLLTVVLIAAFLAPPLSAQVNTERLRRADSTTGVFFKSSLSFGIVRGNSEYLSVKSAARLDYARTGNDNFAVVEYEFKESRRGKIANKGFVHLRSIWTVTRILSVEGFGQAEFNEFLSLKNRDLLGAGARFRALEHTAGDGRSVLSLFLGVGAMFEHEQYDTRPSDTRFDRVRSTNYCTVTWDPHDRASWSLVGYVQPLLEDPADIRVTAESSLEFALSSSFRFHVSASWRYHSRPVLAVKTYDLEILNGVSFSLP